MTRVNEETSVAAAPISVSARLFLLALTGVGACVFIGVVAWQLLADGPFLWHAGLPQFWQGGLEALALIAALSTLQFWRRRGWRIAVSLLLAELYLRRHAVDAAAFLDLFYLELIIALGAGVTRLCGGSKPDNIMGYLGCFVLGFCAWSVCAWGVSALGFGTLQDLRTLTLLLLIPALVARSRPLSLFVARRTGEMTTPSRVAVAMLAAWLLILFAHSAIAFGYDSQWYGLRGDRVLVGEGSIFAMQGLVAPVYYFPKIYELFLIPVSGLGSSSVIAGVSIATLALIALAAYEILGRLGVRDALVRITGVGLVISLPAMANSSLEAKPDLLAALFVLLAWIHAANFVRTRAAVPLLWSLALLILAPQAKLTAIPFAAALVLITAITALGRRRTGTTEVVATDRRLAIVVLALALIVTLFATARTWLLTGVPTIGPDPLFKLWLALGFKLRFPVGTLEWSYPTDWVGIPQLAVDLLFRPQRLEHIVISWTGNVWLWLGIVAIAARCLSSHEQREHFDRSTFLLGGGLAAATFVLMFCWGFAQRGGDGNYFLAGLIPAIVLGAAAAWRWLPRERAPRRAFLYAAFAFILFQSSYSFLSTAWHPGTRAFDIDLTRSVYRFRDDSKQEFDEAGIARIAGYLRHLHHSVRVIGCTQLSDALGMRLPASYEWFAQVGFARHEFTDSVDHFVNFLKNDRIDYLLVPEPLNPRFNCRNQTVLMDTVAWLEQNPHVTALRDEGYVLYDLSGLR